MKKRKKAALLNVENIDSMKLSWKVERQVQQEILQKKLMQCFLEPSEGHACIARYPEAMQPMIKDFMRKAEKQIRLYETGNFDTRAFSASKALRNSRRS
jgi:hypothetical protein